MSDLNKKSLNQNMWVKIGLTIVMSFFLLIPAAHIKQVINERHEFGQVAKKEVAEKWSKSQIAGALVLSIPVIETIEGLDENDKPIKKYNNTEIHFLPNKLNIKSDTRSVIRYRGLYKVPLYETKLSFSGDFVDVSPSTLDMENTRAVWDKAILSLGIKEVRGLKNIEMKWNDKKLEEEVGEMSSALMGTAINGLVGADKGLVNEGVGKFYVEVTLRGSEALEFYPAGQTTTIDMNSNWGSPSFNGSYLPESHEIEEEKFNAHWKILGLTRNLPKHWAGFKNLSNELSASKFGVDLHMPLQSYQLNTRSVKYALLFILLTFVTMFFIEAIYKIRFHLMHYAMTGASLILFYLLLLSFSEHVGFGVAYFIAGSATILTISMYVLGITKVKKSAAIVFGQLALLYGFLFVLLKQEDFTLVFGASGLWIILAVLMYATRKIDWFALNLVESKQKVQS